MTAHGRFAHEVRRAMERRRVTGYALADALGMTQHQVDRWRQGASLPRLAMAARVADALDAPVLLEIVREARTYRCRGCNRLGISEGTGYRRRYCSDACRYLAAKLGRGGKVITRERNRLQLYGDAVGEFCRDCSPSGLCNDGECPLRVVSPLPLSEGIKLVPRPVDGRRNRWDRPGERERASKVMAERHRANPEHRAKISESNRRRWAEMTPERRSEIGRKIAAGRYAA